MFRLIKRLVFGENKPCSIEPSPEELLLKRLKPYEQCLYKVQDIVIWKDFSFSLLFIVLVNIFFWFLSHFEWRFFGALFTVVCLLILHDAWFNYLYPQICVNKRLSEENSNETTDIDVTPPEGVYLSLPEISRYATEFQTAFLKQYEKFKTMRRTQPAVFCVWWSSVWLTVAGLGTALSGLALLYLLSMALLIVPGYYIHLMSSQQKQYFFTLINSFHTIIFPPEENVDDYVPDTSQENLEILSKAGDNSNDLSTPSSDSSMADLLIPGHDESSMDNMESFLLDKPGSISETDSEESSSGALSFQSNHFNKTGSSSGPPREDVLMPDDTQFPDVLSAGMSSGLSGVLTGVLYKTFLGPLPGLQLGAIGEDLHPPPQGSDIDSDNSSEFEIINEDAFQS